jgi:hypothetical protein
MPPPTINPRRTMPTLTGLNISRWCLECKASSHSLFMSRYEILIRNFIMFA